MDDVNIRNINHHFIVLYEHLITVKKHANQGTKYVAVEKMSYTLNSTYEII